MDTTQSIQGNVQQAAAAHQSAGGAYCGFINLLKPPGMTSAYAVGFVKRTLNTAHIGHAGTLDPQAAGVLPLMIGKATRLFDYLQDKEKRYICEIAFGSETDTLDAQGIVTKTGNNYPTIEALGAALPRFIGAQLQRPPMVSAIKVDGRRMYDVAREGGTVALEERPVTVHSLRCLYETKEHGAMLDIRSSKGFYVRSLCRDLGQALGCPAHMRFLLRAKSGVFSLDTAVTLEELATAASEQRADQVLLPMDYALGHIPRVEIPQRLFHELANGIPLPKSHFPALPQEQPLRLYMGDTLLAIGEIRGVSLKQRTWLMG